MEGSASRRESDSLMYSRQNLVVSQPLERSLNENAMHNLDLETGVMDRFRTWLYTLLETDAIRKTLYQNILSQTLRKHGFEYAVRRSWMIPALLFRQENISSTTDAEAQERTSNSSNAVLSVLNVVPTTVGSLRRRSTKTIAVTRTIGSRAIHLAHSRELGQLDDPTDFPLPLPPIVPLSQIGSNLEAEEDDLSHFPLPRSPAFEVGDGDQENIDVEDGDWCCVPLPPSPTSTCTEPLLIPFTDNIRSAIQSALHTPISKTPAIKIETPNDDNFLFTKESVSAPIPRRSYDLLATPGNRVDLSSSAFRSRSWWDVRQYAPRLNERRSQSTGAVPRP
jgi:hypothetical protein